jgi:hypothetical protein
MEGLPVWTLWKTSQISEAVAWLLASQDRHLAAVGTSRVLRDWDFTD